MKRMKLIYNPNSGKKKFKTELDTCISKFQAADIEVHIFRTIQRGDIDAHLATIDPAYYDYIVVSGGDGTVNIVINAIMKYGLADCKLGIIPSGTANDFASFLNIPQDANGYCDVILKDNIVETDIGCANGTYFINVLAGGLMSGVSQNVDERFKDFFGKTAYYIKGMEVIPNFKPLSVRVTTSEGVKEEELYMFIVLNSSGTGGLQKLSPEASISDGLFDFIGFRACPLIEIPLLLMKWAAGDYLSDERILFFKDQYIKVEVLTEDEANLKTDVDGETGPTLPVEIHVVPKALHILSNY